ncbi:MAG: hypothetical protein ACI4KG_03285 [Oscillospiraceae bacterium]
MKNGMKRTLSAAVAVLTTAVLAVTAYAADYAQAPSFSETPRESVAVKTEDISEAIDNAVVVDTDTDKGDDSSKSEEKKVATIEVKSVETLTVSPSIMKKLDKSEDTVLEIVSPKAVISIDSSTITKARKIDLSMKVYGSSSRSVVKMRSKKDFGCEVKIEVTSCKLSAKKLAKAHVYCDGVDLGPVELNEDGVPVITATKGGTYEIK